MKSLLLSFLFSFPILLSGQDWAPINSKWSPQFGLDGGETIDFSIKIDSTAISAGNTWYYLHPAYSICAACALPVSECGSELDSLYLKQSPLFGDSILLSENTYTLFGPDLIVKPLTGMGDSYEFIINSGNQLTAMVTEYAEMEIFGIPDSIKTFAFSDNREIILSKNHGIISFSTQTGGNQTLSGIPELQLGDYFPGMREFYNFEAGDVFVYAGNSYMSENSEARLFRIDITNVLVFADSITITYNTSWKSTVWNPYPSLTSTYYSENDIQTTFYNNQSLQGLIPGMFSYDIDSVQMFAANTYTLEGNPYNNSYQAIATENNGRRGLSLGGYSATFEPFFLSPFDYVNYVYISGEGVKANSLLCEAEDGFTNYLLNDSLTVRHENMGSCEVFLEYSEGLGLTFFYNDCGLANNQTYMIGYQKGGDEYGTIFTPGEILDNREILTEDQVNVFPIPSGSNITISIPEQYSGTFDISLTDISGRKVLSQKGLNNNSTIDINRLPAGTYILSGENEQVAFTRKVVVE